MVGKVFALKVGYEDAMRHSSGVCSKLICAILLLMLNACCVVGCVYLLSSLIYEDPAIPTQDWMIASALYFIQHTVVYETLSVFVVHVAVPSMVQQSIVAVRNILCKLLKQVVQSSGYLHEKPHEESLSSQEYFYVSRIVSHAFPSVFESQVVSAYNSPWLRDEVLEKVVTVNLPRQTGGSICCAGDMHNTLLYIGSSYLLLVQHMLMYTLFSSVSAGVVILVYYLSTDSAVIIAAVFIQLLLLLFVPVIFVVNSAVTAPSMSPRIIPNDILAGYESNEVDQSTAHQTASEEYSSVLPDSDYYYNLSTIPNGMEGTVDNTVEEEGIENIADDETRPVEVTTSLPDTLTAVVDNDDEDDDNEHETLVVRKVLTSLKLTVMPSVYNNQDGSTKKPNYMKEKSSPTNRKNVSSPPRSAAKGVVRSSNKVPLNAGNKSKK